MLDQLLELLQAGGTYQIADLAQELQTTPELVEAMLDDLARMEYLKQVGGECRGTCATCPLANTCTVGGPSRGRRGGQVWAFVAQK